MNTTKYTPKTAVIAGLILVLLAGCGPPPGTGRVIIRLAADLRDLDNVASLEIKVNQTGVHSADRPIETDWIMWQPGQHRIDLAALGPNKRIEIGAGDVPAGRYDRARAVVKDGQARTAGGMRIPLTLTVEPIAVPFNLENNDQIGITIELIALAQADGGYEVFTKSAVINR